MKHATKQSVKLFAAVLFFMLAAKVTAQNTVYEVSGVKSTNSIIRTLDPDRYVIYNDYNGVPTFGYADIINGTYTEASMSSIPQLVINDMEIVNGNVYFCGKLSYLPYVLFGFFDINSVFFSGGSINYCIMSSLTMTSPSVFSGYTETFTNLLRIEPYVLSANDVHIFMVGESEFTDPAGGQHQYRCLIDAQYKGTTTLELSTLEDPNGVFYFNDIAATASYLVAAGDKHGGTGNYMTRIPLPVFPLFYYFNTLSSTFFYYWCADIDYFPIPDARIEALGNDAFATVCKGFVGGNVGTGTSGITLTTYGSAIGFTAQHLMPNPYNVKGFRDLKFNPKDSNLYYVPEYSLTTNPQYVFCSQIMPGYNIGTDIEEPVFAIPTICSLDTKKDADGAFASGFSKAQILNMWNVEVSKSPCAAPTQIPPTNNYFAMSSDFFDFYSNIDSPMLNSRQPNINIYQIDPICE